MTTYEQGDVVLVCFVFTNERGAKRRPAVVVSTSEYHQGRQEVIVAAITSNVDRLLDGDHLISGWQEAGLLFPSVATGIVRTIKQTMIERRLGTMPPTDMQAIQSNCGTF
ncbi:MAG: type II toxin-antitoxin system PemK/MazF family toxin [Anaerolineae bacterium]